MNEIKIIAPVVSIPVECALDRMIARDTGRRVADALGFTPAAQAQVGTAALTLTDLLLKNTTFQELHFFGIRKDEQVGIRMSCSVPWLASHPESKVFPLFHERFDSLTDQVEFHPGHEPLIVLTFWRKRKVDHELSTRAHSD